MSHLLFHQRTITELAAALRAGEVSSVELTRYYLDRIEELNVPLNAYRIVCPERALNEAQAADQQLRAGNNRNLLRGVPYAAKDLYDAHGLPTTAGTHLLAENVAQRDAAVVSRLQDAGMVLLGKTNTVQFAYGAVGINHDHGTPHNPWHEDHHVPGGSSSGSGVAVAAGLAPMALGSDTGGSVRIPSSLCGNTGLKTTVGQISRAGVYPLSWTLDSVGPLARSVEDAAHLYQAMQGADPDDATTAGRPRHDVLGVLTEGVRGFRLAFAEGVFFENVDDEVATAVRACGQVFKDLGAEVAHIDLPDAERVSQLNGPQIIIAAEAWISNRNYVDNHFDDLDPVVASRLILGRNISAEEYLRFYVEMMNLRQRIDRVLIEVDALLLPTTAVPALPLAEVDADLESYFEYNFSVLRNTAIGNILNLCGLSVPCGFTKKGLPIGLMLYGRAFHEEKILRIGHAFQEVTDWHRRTPDLSWTVA